MVRMVGAVIGAYVFMAVLVFAGLSGLWAVLGADGAFRPGTYHLTTSWFAGNMVVNIVAALAGGYLAALLAAGSRAATALAGAVLVLGLLFALPVVIGNQPDPGPRTGGVSMAEAIGKAQQPPAVAVAGPLVGAVGVLLGGRLRRSGGGR